MTIREVKLIALESGGLDRLDTVDPTITIEMFESEVWSFSIDFRGMDRLTIKNRN